MPRSPRESGDVMEGGGGAGEPGSLALSAAGADHPEPGRALCLGGRPGSGRDRSRAKGARDGGQRGSVGTEAEQTLPAPSSRRGRRPGRGTTVALRVGVGGEGGPRVLPTPHGSLFPRRSRVLGTGSVRHLSACWGGPRSFPSLCRPKQTCLLASKPGAEIRRGRAPLSPSLASDGVTLPMGKPRPVARRFTHWLSPPGGDSPRTGLFL